MSLTSGLPQPDSLGIDHPAYNVNLIVNDRVLRSLLNDFL
jgi:hypothetical protein